MPHTVRALLATLLLGMVIACGGGSSPSPPAAPSNPAPPPPPPPPSTQWSVAGRVVDASSGAPVPGAVLEPAGFAAVTAGQDGTFFFQSQVLPQYSPYLMTVQAPGYITRGAQVMWERGARTSVEISLIRDAPPFSLDFYRQLVRNGYDQPGNLLWLRRWTTPPRFYVRTVDEETGRAVEPEVIALVRDWLGRSVTMWTGWTSPQIEAGVEPRADQPDWIRVIFERNEYEFCGRSFVGRNPGVITLALDACDCGSRKVPPDTIVHEVGHALGFWHVSDRRSVMYPIDPGGCRPAELSAAESYHAAIAYTRPNNSRDVDTDWEQAGLSLPAGRVLDVEVVD